MKALTALAYLLGGAVVLGSIAAAYMLAGEWVCRRCGVDTKADLFPVWLTGSFVLLLLLLLPLFP